MRAAPLLSQALAELALASLFLGCLVGPLLLDGVERLARLVRERITLVSACVLAALAAAGCTRAMTNDEIIAETKKCEAAGLRTAQLTSLSCGDRTCVVECRPRREP